MRPPRWFAAALAQVCFTLTFSTIGQAQVTFLSRTGWTVRSFDSQESDSPATNILDGNAGTMWHTQWRTASPGHPHEIQLDLGATRSIGGFAYLPRQDRCSNGTIRQYDFYTSINGTNWGTPAASGSFAYTGLTLNCSGTGNIPPEQRVTFPARNARYVRLVSRREVNNNPWASMAELNLISGAASPGRGQIGEWTSVIPTSVNPVGAAVLPDGKVLMWSAYDRYSFAQNVAAQTLTAIFDPVTLTSTEKLVVETAHDMFCPGTSFLGDGRLLITGGDTAAKTSLYNPYTNLWTSGGNMNVPRGYQGQTILDDGRAFVLGGSWSGGSLGKNGEVWSGNSWTYLPNALASVTLGPDPGGAATADRHPWVFGIGNGRVAHVGPSVAMNIYDVNANGGSTTPAGNRADDIFSQNGTAVMYDIGKILKAGGAPAYNGANATAGSYVIDVSNGISVSRTGNLRLARGMHNSVVMPNGEVIVVGGMPVPEGFVDTNAIMTTEIWNPASGQWRDAAAISVPRVYHSTALLLPDGRIFSGGGGLCGQGCAANHSDVQLYSPAYLFNSDGSPATRPTISQAPATVYHSSTIDITSDGSQFVMIRLGAVTHSVNTDQRRVPLQATSLGNGVFRLTIPDQGVAPPGPYMLFALNPQGTPSHARSILVGPAPRPTVTISAPLSGANFVSPANIVIQAQVTDPIGSAVRVEYFNGSVRLGQTTVAPHRFTWNSVSAGAYTIRATVVDNAGNTNSATVPITVTTAQNFTNTATMGTATAPFNGTAFTLNCQPNEVVAGVTGRSSQYVDAVSPLCVAVRDDGAWLGSPVARGSAGGAGGTAFTRTCPANQAVSGFQGRAGSGVDQLDIGCQPLSSGGNVSGPRTFQGPVGGAGGNAVSPIACASPTPASAIRGIAGTYVGQFGLACGVPAIIPNRAPVISIASPANNATFTAPADIVISTNVSDPDHNLAKVEFFNGATKLGEATSAPYTFNWNNVLAGSYTISAVATDLVGLTATATVSVTVNSSVAPPRVLQSLKGVPIPQPSAFSSYVTNRNAAIALGKALFWDVQVSSDGRTACATCHFQAGADVRLQNQSNPGTLRSGVSNYAFAPTRSNSGPSGPNYKMKPADFPLYVLSNPLDANSAILFDTTDVMGSQGVTKRAFAGATPGQPADACNAVADPVFSGFRQVTGRNAPTVINSVFNLRNFYDGRANHVFNGVDSFGNRNTAAVIYRGNPPTAQRIALDSSSLASQAVQPVTDGGEMSCAGRTFPDVARRLLSARPLARQTVAASDSVLGSYANAGARGTNTTYDAMIRAAFASDLWNSASTITIAGRSYSQMEANFSLFFGLALQTYQATLVSDDAPIDRYFAPYPSTNVANPAALTAEQIAGLNLFMGKGNCVACHAGPQLTNAGTPAFQALQNGIVADRMFQGDGGAGVYDFGFYNIGAQVTSRDLGLGGSDPFGNPLSFARQAISGLFKDPFTVTPCNFSAQPCAALSASSRTVVDGAFKTPTLRNVALTGPYFHNGSRATIEEVVQFYQRAGDARTLANGDSTGFGANPSNLSGNLPRIELSAAESNALVTFLKTALTDDRVAFERAPFDHPELPLTDSTSTMLIPAVGQSGRATPVQPFVNILNAGTLGYAPAPNLPPSIVQPANQSGAQGTSASLQIQALDVEGDGISYSATGLPSGLTIAPATGLISGTPNVAGAFNVTATATDSASNSASVQFTWTITAAGPGPVVVSLTSPAHNATFTLPVNITLAATASQSGGAVVRVEFYDGATLLGASTAAPYQFLWTNAAAGPHTLTARAFGSGNLSATSSAVHITVNAAPASCAFPSVPVTDHFNRANGALGSSWAGQTSRYSISNNQLLSTAQGENLILWPTQLGPDQEAYLKFGNIPAGTHEISLVMKAQSAVDWTGGALVIAYFPSSSMVQAWTYQPGPDWVPRYTVSATFAPGDVIGARFRASTSTIEIFKNGASIGRSVIQYFGLSNASGRAGILVIDGQGTIIDDYGAGTLTCAGGGN